MNIKSWAMASAGLALIASPVAATAAASNSAPTLSGTNSVRASTTTSDDSKIARGGLIVGVLGAIVIATGIYLVIDDDDNDNSDSN